MANDEPINLKKLDLPLVEETKALDFIARWKNTDGSGAELADFQIFIVEMCELLGLPKPDPKSDSTKDASYIFECPVDSYTADGERKKSKNRIDLYRRDCFVMEGKQTGKKIASQGWINAMQKAKNQADNYIRSLPTNEGRPPFIVVVDVGCSIQLYSEFSQSGGIYVPFPDPSHYIITLDELADAEAQERLQTLWIAPDALDPSKYAAQVTREISGKLAELAKSLEQSGFDVERTAHFLKRCLFTMFSEDVDLIPEGSFTELLINLKNTPEYFSDSMQSLWDTMNSGGFEGQLRKIIPRFNGGLFKNIDPIPLTAEQIQLLIDAAKADWRFVEPAIFGTLLERALDPHERHKLGAHYTPRAYVERLVMPTIIEPLRAEWETVKVSVEIYLQQGKENKALVELRNFHLHLCEIRILDPACGSANFLYVSLEHLKRLEGEVINYIQDLSSGQSMIDTEGLTVDPHQFLGLEINPRAAAIAEIVLWIGYLQWHYRIHGKLNLPEPILRDFNNIENRDALITYDNREPMLDENDNQVTVWDGISYKISVATGERIPDESQQVETYCYENPRKSNWPAADYIIGNPPYLGARRIRQALGDGYLQALRNVYEQVPENADFVMYWWHIANAKVGTGESQRMGLITTNSLRQSFCRKVVENSLADFPNLAIAYVIPDHPWVDSADGAAVRVSLITTSTNIAKGTVAEVEEEINGDVVHLKISEGMVTPNLGIGADPAGAELLAANIGISSVGYQISGKGFVLDQSQYELFSNEKYRSLIHPLMSGSDITRVSRDLWVIDLFGLSLNEIQTEYQLVYQWILERVKPERDQNNRKSLRDRWWIFGEPRNTFRPALKDIENIFSTSLTAKHRVFTKVSANTICDSTTVIFAFNDSFPFGVISSRIHICWAMAAGGSLENRPRYNKNVCFESFPFPEINKNESEDIRKLAEKIDTHRKKQQALYHNLTLTKIYNVLEKLRGDKVLSLNEQEINQQGLVSILSELHDDLDRAVFAAYGWQDIGNTLVGLAGATTPLTNKPDFQSEAEEELLLRLVKLNQKRAIEESKGHIRWLRPEYQAPEAQQTDIVLNDIESKSSKPKVATIKKTMWPKDIREQINSLLNLLVIPSTAEQLTDNFKHKPLKQVESVLAALESLGRAEVENDIWILI